MTQDKTLREEFYREFHTFTTDYERYLMQHISSGKIADFYEDKIKSVVREMKRGEDVQMTPNSKNQYNQFGDDLLERLGIK